MTDALLHIAVGPVQDFIAAARRTRDLWFGSHLLSEVSKAAARAIRDSTGATLIFPVPRLDERDVLAAVDGMFEARSGDRAPVIPCPNKLWAIVPAAEADGIAERARAAAMERWDEFAARVLGRERDGDRLIDPARMSTWREQLDRLLEVFAAWRPLSDDSDAAFRSTRDALTAAVEEAKTLRTFAQWSDPPGAARQSSLDASRYGVLADKAHAQRSGRRFRIARGEVLSAVDLVKRAGGRPEQFVPVTNVALAPWHIHARETRPTEWEAADEALAAFDALFEAGKDEDETGRDRARERVRNVYRERLRAGRITMAFDAQVLLENRCRKTLEEAMGPYREAGSTYQQAADAVEQTVAHLLAKTGRPPVPYVACLVADGDRLGDVIRTLGRAASTALSEALCQFSVEASEIVDAHLGLPVYAGGDDVLALVPLETAAACADALNAAYHQFVGQRLRAYAPDALVSFSVGIGIGHVLDALSDLLALGREAEKQAKGNDLPRDQQRRAVAVIMEKRGGQRRAWRARWPESDGEPSPPAAIQAAVERVREGALSTRKLFELDDMLRRMKVELPDVPSLIPESEAVSPAEREARAAERRAALALRAELFETLRSLAARIIGRSEGRGGRGDREGEARTLAPADVGLDFDRHADYEAAHAHLRGWVELHVIARLLADATYRKDTQADASTGDAS